MPAPSALEYQLDMVKLEIETINTSIRQMDEISKSIKEWAIGLWTAAVGGALAVPRLTPFVGLTAVLPLLFWLVDTWHRRIQRKFIWRGIAIGDFLNDGRLSQSIESGTLIGFDVFDPPGRRLANRADGDVNKRGYQDFVSWRKVMMFPSVSILYLGLTSVSLIVGALAGLKIMR
jgi:hypothetical protein